MTKPKRSVFAEEIEASEGADGDTSKRREQSLSLQKIRDEIAAMFRERQREEAEDMEAFLREEEGIGPDGNRLN